MKTEKNHLGSLYYDYLYFKFINCSADKIVIDNAVEQVDRYGHTRYEFNVDAQDYVVIDDGNCLVITSKYTKGFYWYTDDDEEMEDGFVDRLLVLKALLDF